MFDKNNKRPIFIMGCERSGTTMLRLMLHNHPNIALPPQTKFMKKIYKRRILFGNLGKEKNRQKLITWLFKHDGIKSTRLVDMVLDRDAIKYHILNANPALGSILSVLFKLYSEKFHKSRWGDKRPYYIKYVDQLLALFPDAQIIHLIRDGRDCMASLKQMPWWQKSSLYTILHWREAIRQGSRARRKLNTSQYFELRYEDLVTDPEQWLKKVCHFLEEDYTPEMLMFQDLAKIAVPECKIGWHAATRKQINTHSIRKWKTDLATWEQTIFNRVAANELRLFGYTHSNQHTAIPISIWIKYYIILIIYVFDRQSKRMLDGFISLFYPWPLDHRLGSNQKKQQ